MIYTKRTFCLVSLLMLYMVAWAQTSVSLRFQRSGTDASSTRLSLVDQDGNVIAGAQAKLASNQVFKSTGGNISAEILCPNVNATSSPTIELTFTITGLPAKFCYNTLGLDIHALNGGGMYQNNSDGRLRQWNIEVQHGNELSKLTSLASFSNIDIAAGVGTTGSVHKMWMQTFSQQSASSPLVLKVQIAKGRENIGCFFGLSEIRLSQEKEQQPLTLPRPGEKPRVCNIVWKKTNNNYMSEHMDHSVRVAAYDVRNRIFWEVIPTETEDVFYVRNTATGRYLGSCNLRPDAHSRIFTSTTPVPYYIQRSAAKVGEIVGCHWLSSIDCQNYNDEAAGPQALNKDGASEHVITWQAGTNRPGSYWTLIQSENLYEPRPAIVHSTVALSKQIYMMPCSVTGSNYVRSLIMGDLSYNSMVKPKEGYTLYTASRGSVAQGDTAKLVVAYDAALKSGVEAWVCLDWDRDGVFETVFQLPAKQNFTFNIPVPETAHEGRTRMRVRLSESGLPGPDEDVIGQAIDFVLHVTAKQVTNNLELVQHEGKYQVEVANEGRSILVKDADVRYLRLYALDGSLIVQAKGNTLCLPQHSSGVYVLGIEGVRQHVAVKIIL